MDLKTIKANEALKFYEEEIYQIDMILGGILTCEYKDFLEKKMEYYQLAINLIKEKYKNHQVYTRLDAIQSGTGFGDQDTYSPDSYFPFKLLEVISLEKGDILVKDTSQPSKKSFVTNVTSVFIEGID